VDVGLLKEKMHWVTVWVVPMAMVIGLSEFIDWAHWPRWVGYPFIIVVFPIVAYLGSIFWWQWVADRFGWEIPVEEDD